MSGVWRNRERPSSVADPPCFPGCICSDCTPPGAGLFGAPPQTKETPVVTDAGRKALNRHNADQRAYALKRSRRRLNVGGTR